MLDISLVDLLWLQDLWAQPRVVLVPGSWEIRPEGFGCKVFWVAVLVPGGSLLLIAMGEVAVVLLPWGRSCSRVCFVFRLFVLP